MPPPSARRVPRPALSVARSFLVGLLVLASILGASAPATADPAPRVPITPAPVGVWPLRPHQQVMAGFDPPDSDWGAGHRGVDLLGSVSQPVHTALPGRVAFAGRLAGRGVVVVDHGATRTTYEPVTASVDVGEEVARGETVGVLELSGSHCLPRACLHWGWLRGETYLDPLLLVGSGPVRLLPLSGVWSSTSLLAQGWSPLRSPYAAWQPPLRTLLRSTRLGRALTPGGAPAGRPDAAGPS